MKKTIRGPRGTRKRFRSIAVVCSALSVLFSVALGSAASANAASGGTIVVGNPAALTGPFASFGAQSLTGLNTAVKEVNSAGGVLGEKLRLTTADTGGDVADSIVVVERMLATQHPSFIVCGCQSDWFAYAHEVAKDHVPTFTIAGLVAFDRNTNPYLWRTNPSDSQLGLAMALTAIRRGYKRASIMFANDNPTEQPLANSVKSFYVKLGGKITSDVTVASGQSSYLSEVHRALAGHPQVIFTQTDDTTASAIFKDLGQIDHNSIPVIGTDATAGSDYISAIGAGTAHKELTSVEGVSPSSPSVSVYAHWRHDVAKGLPQANEEYPYDGVILAALAMEAARSTNGAVWDRYVARMTVSSGPQCASFAQCLALLRRGHKTIDYEGVTGDLAFNRYHNVFGPFAVVHANTKGVPVVVASYSATLLAHYTNR